MVELLVDLLLAVPADEFDGDIGAAYVLGTLEASQGLLVETDDGSVFHVGITAVR